MLKKFLTIVKESAIVLKERLGVSLNPIKVNNPFLGENEMKTSVPTRQVTFVKSNGQEREMRFQRLSDFPESDSRYNSNPRNGMNETVYDVENADYRIINHGTIVKAEKIVG